LHLIGCGYGTTIDGENDIPRPQPCPFRWGSLDDFANQYTLIHRYQNAAIGILVEALLQLW